MTFISALRSNSVEMPERVGGFVLGICRNLARDRARQNERREQLWETFAPQLEAMSPELTAPSERSMKLEDCMGYLSQRARDLLTLSFGQCLDHKEVGQRLGLSEENARVIRHRTLASLKKCLDTPMSWSVA